MLANLEKGTASADSVADLVAAAGTDGSEDDNQKIEAFVLSANTNLKKKKDKEKDENNGFIKKHVNKMNKGKLTIAERAE